MNTKVFILLAAAMGMAVTTEAQTVSFGSRLGANLSTLRVIEGEKMFHSGYSEAYGYITGAQFGAVVNIGLSDRFSIQPELLYSQKGHKVRSYFIEDDDLEDMRAKLRMNYLEVPVLAKLSFGNKKLQFFLTAGPSVGYWVSGRSEWAYAGLEENKAYVFRKDYKHGLKENRLDVGANVGFGVAYPLGTGKLNLDVRYGLGLSDISKYEDDRPDHITKDGHRTFGVSVAYLFKRS